MFCWRERISVRAESSERVHVSTKEDNKEWYLAYCDWTIIMIRGATTYIRTTVFPTGNSNSKITSRSTHPLVLVVEYIAVSNTSQQRSKLCTVE